MEHTNIEWCDSTINGSSGCDGCELWNENKKTCYAGITHETRWAKGLAISHPELYSPSFSEVRMIPGRFARAASWPDLRGKPRPDKPWLNGRPRHIFVGDMGDFLSRAVTEEFLYKELLGAITSPAGSRHVWMLLTKRPLRLAELAEKWGGLPDNVIAMTTVTSQRMADLRIPQLLEVRCKTRMLSIEPMLSAVDFKRHLTRHVVNGMPMVYTGIDGVIAGGESGRDLANPGGPGPVPMHPDWARSLRDQAATTATTFFFKQWGHWAPFYDRDKDDPDWQNVPQESDDVRRINLAGGHGFHGERVVYFRKAGKKGAGRLLDGREWNDLPEVNVA